MSKLLYKELRLAAHLIFISSPYRVLVLVPAYPYGMVSCSCLGPFVTMV